jgi:S-adenosyl-L-methionine hydrolase (adenosine-forming)
VCQQIIALLTDVGTRDAYLGAMKGVILSIERQIQIVDISHDVPPQDIVEAAWLLCTAHRYFPSGTVHLVVVDPGVGSRSRAIAVHALDSYLVAVSVTRR